MIRVQQRVILAEHFTTISDDTTLADRMQAIGLAVNLSSGQMIGHEGPNSPHLALVTGGSARCR